MIHSTREYYENKIAQLQLRLDKLSRNRLLSDRQREMIERGTISATDEPEAGEGTRGGMASS